MWAGVSGVKACRQYGLERADVEQGGAHTQLLAKPVSCARPPGTWFGAARSRPLVSAVIPVRNSRATLRRALQSVAHQDYAPLEVVVVDDGSVDNVSGVLGEFADLNVVLKRLDAPEGAAAARNVGLLAASGEFVAFLDADDEWLPGKIERQIVALLADPAISFAYSAVLASVPGKPDVRLKEIVDVQAHGPDAWKTLLKHGCVVTSSVVARRDHIWNAGGFAEGLVVAEDQDLWIRLALLGPVHHDSLPLVRKWKRPNGLSTLHRQQIASVTLPMVEAHVVALADRLTKRERKNIVAYRRLVAGRNCYESGQFLKGVGLVLSATSLGGQALQNFRYLLSASPIAMALKRMSLSRVRATAPSAKGDEALVVVIDVESGLESAAPANEVLRHVLDTCRRHGVRPTFLVGPLAVANARLCEQLISAIEETRGDIGISMAEVRDEDQVASDAAYQRELNAVAAVADGITAAFGRRPTVHRARPQGASRARLMAIEALGFEVDICGPRERSAAEGWLVASVTAVPLLSEGRARGTGKSWRAVKSGDVPACVEISLSTLAKDDKRREFDREFQRLVDHCGLTPRLKGARAMTGAAESRCELAH